MSTEQPQPEQRTTVSDHAFRRGRDAAHCGFLYWQASGKHIECDQPESDHPAPAQESGGGEAEWRYRECKRQLDSVRLQLAAVEDRLRISEVLKGQLQEDKAALTQRAEKAERERAESNQIIEGWKRAVGSQYSEIERLRAVVDELLSAQAELGQELARGHTMNASRARQRVNAALAALDSTATGGQS